jgi:tripartite-type tricarboxylate transporter receptor subunit TctC
MRKRLAIILTSVTLAVSQVHAQTLEEFYKGKRITLTVGYGPGGGYDIFARLLARHFGKYVPGNPQVIVQNMPGAGSLISANYIYSVAPKDGAAFGLFAPRHATARPHGPQSQCPVRSSQIHVAWVVVEFLRRRLRYDRA